MSAHGSYSMVKIRKFWLGLSLGNTTLSLGNTTLDMNAHPPT